MHLFQRSNLLHFIILFFVACTFNSCLFGLKSKDPEYTFHYYAEYHRDYSDRTIAGWIIDTEDETNADLMNDEEGIFVNESWGSESSYYPYKRTNEFEGLVPELKFEYVNKSGESFSNTTDIYELDTIALPYIPPYMDRDLSYEIEWIGPPVQQGEKIEIEISAWPFVYESYFVSTETIGDTKLTITPDILTVFYYEEMTITISRIKTRALENPKTEGEFTLKYTGPEKESYCN